MLTEQLKFVQIFPITNVFNLSLIFRLKISAYERPQSTPRMYAVHHFDGVGILNEERDTTQSKTFIYKHIVI